MSQNGFVVKKQGIPFIPMVYEKSYDVYKTKKIVIRRQNFLEQRDISVSVIIVMEYIAIHEHFLSF